MNKPFDIEFCRYVKCPNRQGNRCIVDECIYNHKRIIYWQHFGRLPGEE